MAPPPRLTISQWADKERVLSSESSAEPGRWSTDRAPFQRGIMDAITDPSVERVAYIKSAQVGATETILNTIGYYSDHDPCPILVLQPTLGMAEAFSKDRLGPMLRDTPSLRAKVGGGKSRDGENTILHKKFPGGHITLAGANSPASLASRPIRIALCDEVDRYPKSAGKEGDPVKLASKRTTTFWNRKVVLVATPTVEGESRIEQEWLASDQRRFFLACPHCAHRQHLVWEQLKWKPSAGDPRRCDPDSVAYECVSCRKTFRDYLKLELLISGEWRATAPRSAVVGFHINELYSPWKRWHEVVDDFLDSKDDPEKLMVWWNTSMGLAYKRAAGEAPKWEDLYSRREDRQRGIVPMRAVALTAAVDVQKDRLELSVYGWNRREPWLVDHVVIMGDTSLPPSHGPWPKLAAELDRDWQHEGGRSLRIDLSLIDSGYNTTAVYAFVASRPRGSIRAIKGQQTLPMPIGSPKAIDVRQGDGKRLRRGVRVWPVGTNLLKGDIVGRLYLKRPTDEELAAHGYPPTYVHFPMMDEEFFRQLTAEEQRRDGKGRVEWVKIYHANEVFDLLCYNLAAWYGAGLSKRSEAEWDQMAADLGVRLEKPKATQDKNAAQPERPKKARQRASSGFW